MNNAIKHKVTKVILSRCTSTLCFGNLEKQHFIDNNNVPNFNLFNIYNKSKFVSEKIAWKIYN